MKLGILGGTFNPIHFGHLRAAEEAHELAGLDRVIFIPSGNPPLKAEDIAPARHRYAMAKRAINKNPHFDLLDLECRTRQKSYTVTTLEKLHQLYPDDTLHFMLGIDAFLDIPNWYRPERLLSLAHFLILSRPGCRFAALSTSPYLSVSKETLRKLDAGTIPSYSTTLTNGNAVLLLNISPVNISATDIRTRMAAGKSAKYLLPAAVESYIISHKLYAFRKPQNRAVKRECRS
ncbi:MAG: nicotinate (nicotinamide) nucleotide adenylyltransferase [Nitrospirae bacterium]|nr:nicotinate (nicotinamide) nucleotide adenylyltransferase [Nitrospirota bacterium]